MGQARARAQVSRAKARARPGPGPGPAPGPGPGPGQRQAKASARAQGQGPGPGQGLLPDYSQNTAKLLPGGKRQACNSTRNSMKMKSCSQIPLKLFKSIELQIELQAISFASWLWLGCAWGRRWGWACGFSSAWGSGCGPQQRAQRLWLGRGLAAAARSLAVAGAVARAMGNGWDVGRGGGWRSGWCAASGSSGHSSSERSGSGRG